MTKRFVRNAEMNKKTVKHGIISIMFTYWILVILWQTLRPVDNRSITDSLVKIILFGFVLLHAFINRDITHSKKITAVFAVFVLTQCITMFTDRVTTGSLITVAFMFVEIVVFLIMQRDEEITEESLEWFGKMLIMVGIVMGLYSILFKTGRFVRAFTNPNAYNSECKSFLYSNHEYALYLSVSIIFAAWMQFRKRGNAVLSVLILCFLAVNLVSTFSRTAIIGCVGGLIILSFAMGSRTTGYLILAFAAAVCAIWVSDTLRTFFFQKILKNSIADSGSLIDKGRAALYRGEWSYYINGTFMEKLFGHGYNGNQTGGHNAYLMILNTGGAVMFLFFAVTILWSISKALICYRIHRETGSLCFALQILILLNMAAQTPILFYSTMDSYFITMLFVMIPLYLSNQLLRSARWEKVS